MDRFIRQSIIRGWNQDLIRQSAVVVYGRNWNGCFAVWGLANLGIKDIAWVGIPEPQTNRFANWLLADPCPISDTSIIDYPFAVEFGSEMQWVLEGRSARALLDCANDTTASHLLYTVATEARVPYFCGVGVGGGWLGESPPRHDLVSTTSPVTSMLIGGLLVDAAVRCICRIAEAPPAVDELLNLHTPASMRKPPIALVGVGGIGVYALTLIAMLGYPVYAIDHDRVETTNLNRQGLFTAEDVANRLSKVTAAAIALKTLFPVTPEIIPVNDRVRAGSQALFNSAKPRAILSAVDNAETRLVLQNFGCELGVPVIQAGTTALTADCFTQESSGRLLDEQMFGALSKAAQVEHSAPPRVGSCAADPSYVVPGMIAGALLVHRMIQALELYHGLIPIRWRCGGLPKEDSPQKAYEFNIA